MRRKNVARHRQQFGRSPRTVRQHAVRWLGYVDAVRYLVDLGVEMERNYAACTPYRWATWPGPHLLLSAALPVDGGGADPPGVRLQFQLDGGVGLSRRSP